MQAVTSSLIGLADEILNSEGELKSTSGEGFLEKYIRELNRPIPQSKVQVQVRSRMGGS